jgi:hypothetical protein
MKKALEAVPALGGLEADSFDGDRGAAVVCVDDFLWQYLGAYVLAPFLISVTGLLYRGWCMPSPYSHLVMLLVALPGGCCVASSCFACGRRRAANQHQFFASLGLANASGDGPTDLHVV